MQSPEANSDAESDPTCQKAISIARYGESLYWDLAELLASIQSGELWRKVGATSFKQFIQDFVRMPESTSRQLIKVHQMCNEQSISRDRVEKLGWSKLAEIAKSVTPENKESLLADVEQLSLAKLRDKHRTKKGAGETKKSKAEHSIVWSQEIEEAIRQASRFTRSNELQVNLEFIASKFKSLMPLAPDRDIQFSNN